MLSVVLIPSLLLKWVETNDLILKANQVGLQCQSERLTDEL